MIARLASFLLLLFALGFVLFAVTLGEPAPDDALRVDAIVALTGGAGRIERAVEVLADKKGKRLLIAGADPAVTKADLGARVDRKGRRVLACCTDLGSESVDTRSNAEEAERWLARRDAKSVRLVTSDWHMRRALFEFERELDPSVRIIPDAVPTKPNLMLLLGEYTKYVLRRVAVLIDL